MNATKSAGRSLTVVSLLVALLALAADWWGYKLDSSFENDTTEAVLNCIEAGAVLVAMYGRLRATQRLTVAGDRPL